MNAPNPASPESYPRRVLLAVTGLSPQIVTETLYALAVQSRPAFVPTEIHLITTAQGREHARLNLLSADPGWFHRLSKARPAWAKKGEHLGALPAIKRLWPTLFKEEVELALAAGERGEKKDLGRFVVSTHTMALAHQLDQWLEHGGITAEGTKDALKNADTVALPRRLMKRHANNPALSDARRLPALLEDAKDSEDEAEYERARKLIEATLGLESGDGETQHVRGVLVFWDVIPQIKGDSLAVDIMTPHQSHYYQQKRDRKAGDSTTPHDSGQPNPISFLTVPPGSGFAFHVQCDLAHLNRIAPELAVDGRWKTLLTAAFEHAFQWLGFGAKTAVGYGAMEEDPQARKREEQRKQAEAAAIQRAKVEAAHQAALAQMSPIDREIREYLDQRQDKNQPELNALLGALKKGQWSGESKVAVAERAKSMMQAAKKWKEKSEKKNPDKDHDYQDTLKVIAWLKGQ